jgi:hypothetical protein
MACPEGYNVADHRMDLFDSAIEEEEYTKSSYFVTSTTDVENGHGSDTVQDRKSTSRLRRERIQANRRTTRQQFNTYPSARSRIDNPYSIALETYNN